MFGSFAEKKLSATSKRSCRCWSGVMWKLFISFRIRLFIVICWSIALNARMFLIVWIKSSKNSKTSGSSFLGWVRPVDAKPSKISRKLSFWWISLKNSERRRFEMFVSFLLKEKIIFVEGDRLYTGRREVYQLYRPLTGATKGADYLTIGKYLQKFADWIFALLFFVKCLRNYKIIVARKNFFVLNVAWKRWN